MKNKIVCVGQLGIKRCYLNVSRAEAIRRFMESEGAKLEEIEGPLSYMDPKEFEFDDEFGAYDVWGIRD